MDIGKDERLDRLLKEAYPTVEVSDDFTLRLWRRLMNEPDRLPWIVPIPVYGLAAAVGILAGVWTWSQMIQPPTPSSPFLQSDRLDLFGNAPLDTVAGSYLNLIRKGEKT